MAAYNSDKSVWSTKLKNGIKPELTSLPQFKSIKHQSSIQVALSLKSLSELHSVEFNPKDQLSTAEPPSSANGTTKKTKLILSSLNNPPSRNKTNDPNLVYQNLAKQIQKRKTVRNKLSNN